MCPYCANTLYGHLRSTVSVLEGCSWLGLGVAGDGLLATFTSCAIPIAGVLAYPLPGRESHSKSKMSSIEELAWKAVAHSI